MNHGEMLFRTMSFGAIFQALSKMVLLIHGLPSVENLLGLRTVTNKFENIAVFLRNDLLLLFLLIDITNFQASRLSLEGEGVWAATGVFQS